MKTAVIVIMIMGICLTGTTQPSNRDHDLQQLSETVFSLSEVMLHDVVNPPAAARFYAYAMLAGYQTALLFGTGVPDVTGKLKEPLMPGGSDVPKGANLSFCANYAILETGSRLMPSGKMLADKKDHLVQVYRRKFRISGTSLKTQISFARSIADEIVRYAYEDNYRKLSVHPRYTPAKEEGRWYPTPPEYMAAVEPQWKTLRTFFIDSAGQFPPFPPAPFDRDSTSDFYQQMQEVYQTVNTLSLEQRAIADFWDCNPFAVTYSGHLAIGLKKITPGGHWMGITAIACAKRGLSLDSAILVHAAVAMTLHDAFVSCWNEKYSSDRIRPETAINKMIDPGWRPMLQTPPFPEYTSGHSVVSAAAAEILTFFLGDNFAFTDTSEVYFGLPERDFNSFHEAAREAAISRLYGGIHFRDACENGELQGREIGRYIVGKLGSVAH